MDLDCHVLGPRGQRFQMGWALKIRDPQNEWFSFLPSKKGYPQKKDSLKRRQKDTLRISSNKKRGYPQTRIPA